MMLKILFEFTLMIIPDFVKQEENSEYLHATLLFVT